MKLERILKTAVYISMIVVATITMVVLVIPSIVSVYNNRNDNKQQSENNVVIMKVDVFGNPIASYNAITSLERSGNNLIITIGLKCFCEISDNTPAYVNVDVINDTNGLPLVSKFIDIPPNVGVEFGWYYTSFDIPIKYISQFNNVNWENCSVKISPIAHKKIKL